MTTIKSRSPLNTAVTTVSIVASAIAIGFLVFISFSTPKTSTTRVSCRPALFEVFRSRIPNPDFGYNDGIDNANLREALGELGPTFINRCQAPAQERGIAAGGALVLSFGAVLIVRRLESGELEFRSQ